MLYVLHMDGSLSTPLPFVMFLSSSLMEDPDCYNEGDNIKNNDHVRVKKFLSFEVSSDEETPQRPRLAARSATPATPQPFYVTNDENMNEPTDTVLERSKSRKVAPSAEKVAELPSIEKELPNREHSNSSSHSKISSMSIYERSKRQAAASAEKLQKLRFILRQEHNEEYTFKPSISKRAQMLHRSPLDVVESVEKYRARLRNHLLECDQDDECTFAPEICKHSQNIVAKRRSRSEGDVGERLYRQKKKCWNEQTNYEDLKKYARSSKHIDAHIASLYAFHDHKEEVLNSLREEKNHIEPAIHANPSDVIARLAVPKPEVHQDEFFKDTKVPPQKSHAEQKRHLQYLKCAKDRGIAQWFTHFSRGERELSAAQLDEYEGVNDNIREKVKSILQDCTTQQSWTAEEFLNIFCRAEEEQLFSLWKHKIALPPPSPESKFPFYPAVDHVSELIIGRQEIRRSVSANDRLYFRARNFQLIERQKQLEFEQRKIEDEVQRSRKTMRLKEQYRRMSAALLKKHADEKNVFEKTVNSKITSETLSSEGSFSAASEGKLTINSEEKDSSQITCLHKPKLENERSAQVVKQSDVPVPQNNAPLHAPGKPLKELGCHIDYPISSVMLAITNLEKLLKESPQQPTSSLAVTHVELSAVETEEHPKPYSVSSEPTTNPTKWEQPIQTKGINEKIQSSTPDPLNPHEISLGDFLLECSMCRYPEVVSTTRRQNKQHKRRLQELGKALYRKSRVAK